MAFLRRPGVPLIGVAQRGLSGLGPGQERGARVTEGGSLVAFVDPSLTPTMALDSALSINTHPEVAKRVREAMTTLDRTLVDIRTTVTGLET